MAQEPQEFDPLQIFQEATGAAQPGLPSQIQQQETGEFDPLFVFGEESGVGQVQQGPPGRKFPAPPVPEPQDEGGFFSRLIDPIRPGLQKVGEQVGAISSAFGGPAPLGVPPAVTLAQSPVVQGAAEATQDPVSNIGVPAAIALAKGGAKVAQDPTLPAQGAAGIVAESGKDIARTVFDPVETFNEEGLGILGPALDISALATGGIAAGRGIRGALKVGREIAERGVREGAESVAERGAREGAETVAERAPGLIDPEAAARARISKGDIPGPISPAAAQVRPGSVIENPKVLADTVDETVRTDSFTRRKLDELGELGQVAINSIRQFDRTAPEIAAVVRPAFQARNADLLQINNRLQNVLQGVKKGSDADRQIARVLNGDFGSSREVIDNYVQSGLLPDGVTDPRVMDAASEARPILDDLFERLNIVRGADERTQVRYVDDYITWLRDTHAGPDGVRLPPDVLKNVDARTYFRFMERSGAPSPDDLSFIESMSVYVPAAVNSIHMDDALRQVDELVGAQIAPAASSGDLVAANKLWQWQLVQDYLLGRVGRTEGILNTVVGAAGKVLGVDAGSRPAMRLSMSLANNAYRGILGLNVSASVNNLTQTVNTAASAGFLDTVVGAQRFFREGVPESIEGIAVKDDLYGQFVRLLEENMPADRGTITRKMDEVLFAPFQGAEHLNRGIAFHTGASQVLRQAKREGREITSDVVRESVEAGLRLSEQTQFVYDELARNPQLLGPIGRQFSILLSFPIKQTEFLADMAKNDKAGLVRYFAFTGLMARAAREGGFELGALGPSPIGVPGTEGLEFISQIEGVPLRGPTLKVAGDAFNALGALASGNMEEAAAGAATALDAATNLAIPVGPLRLPSTAIKKGLRSARNVQEGKVRQILPPSTGTDAGTFATSMTPFVRDIAGARGNVIADSGPGRETAKFFGMTPVGEAEQRDLTFKAAGFLDEERQRKGNVADIAAAKMREGNVEDAVKLIIDNGINLDGFRTGFVRGEMDPASRIIAGASDAEFAKLLQEVPENLRSRLIQARVLSRR